MSCNPTLNPAHWGPFGSKWSWTDITKHQVGPKLSQFLFTEDLCTKDALFETKARLWHKGHTYFIWNELKDLEVLQKPSSPSKIHFHSAPWTEGRSYNSEMSIDLFWVSSVVVGCTVRTQSWIFLVGTLQRETLFTLMQERNWFSLLCLHFMGMFCSMSHSPSFLN